MTKTQGSLCLHKETLPNLCQADLARMTKGSMGISMGQSPV